MKTWFAVMVNGEPVEIHEHREDATEAVDNMFAYDDVSSAHVERFTADDLAQMLSERRTPKRKLRVAVA